MKKITLGVLLLLLSLPYSVATAQGISATVFDSITRQTLPFATIRFGETGKGVIADVNGLFSIDASVTEEIKWIEVSSLGYETRKVSLAGGIGNIYLRHSDGALKEVVIRPPYEKIKRIIDLAIDHKPLNNPDKLDWYRCDVYYKMIVDALVPPHSVKDTGIRIKRLRDFSERQHLLMSETYSRRTWKKPQQLQEEVTGSKFYGFKKAMFTDMVTDVLPFHSYGDFIKLNGKDYHNPISRGSSKRYDFNLADELLQGKDTLWIISFTPKIQDGGELKGKVYINSNGYAIADFTAKATDTALHRSILIEQQYKLLTTDGVVHWFPAQLNYVMDIGFQNAHLDIDYRFQGNSLIDSVSFNEDTGFNFDKQHTIKLLGHADELSDSAWTNLRPVAFGSKESRTAQFLDSLGVALHFDEKINYFSRLPEGKIPVGILDLDLRRIISANYYENVRLGAGGQTNEKLLKWLSVGAWGGYGWGDTHWKYGMFSEYYPRKNKEFIIRAGYQREISDPGRVLLNSELDKNYLHTYLLRRVDAVKEYSISLKKKIGYLSLELSGRQQEITPKYDYMLLEDGVGYSSMNAREVTLNLRYAYAERTAPVFGQFVSIGTRYPIIYGKVTTGDLRTGSINIPYTQIVTALAWQKHLNRLGNEHLLLTSGTLVSDRPLPLSKLFAGNGFRYDVRSGSGVSYYAFAGMLTMYPYDYYMDKYVNLIYRHDFDWKLYRLKIPETRLSSSPFLSVQYGMLYGTLKYPEAQKDIEFRVPDNAYHEGGFIANSLLKTSIVNLYNVTLNMGYFYHLGQPSSIRENGKFVIGFGVEF